MRQALQFDRQAGDRRVEVAKAGARLRPFALAGEGDRAPDRRVELVADLRIAQLLERVFGPVEHDVGDRA